MSYGPRRISGIGAGGSPMVFNDEDAELFRLEHTGPDTLDHMPRQPVESKSRFPRLAGVIKKIRRVFESNSQSGSPER